MSKVGGDIFNPCDAADECGRTNQIGPLQQFEPAVFQFEAGVIERATFMSDEHDALKLMNFDEKLQFIDHALRLHMRLRMIGQTRRSAGQREPIVPWQRKPVLEKVVEMLADSAV